MRYWMCLLWCGLMWGGLHAQVVRGVVEDGETGGPLAGVAVMMGPGQGTITDAQGRFSLRVPGRRAHLLFYLLGYDSLVQDVIIPAGDTVVRLRVRLHPKPFQLSPVVVVESRRPQTTREAIQSIDVMPVTLTRSLSVRRIDQALTYLPGAQLFKGQLNLRGTSGFTYGAGSRLMLIWNGMPFLTGDVGDIRWNYFPTAHLQQLEVMKGPASALYGAGALEGVVSITEKTAAETPAFIFRMQQGVYQMPDSVKSPLTWANWRTGPRDTAVYLPYFTMLSGGWRQRLGPVQVFASSLWEADNSYRFYDEHIRQVHHLRLRTALGDVWVFSVSGGWMQDTGYNFLFAPDLRRPYRALPGTQNPYRTRLWHADATAAYLLPAGKLTLQHRTTDIYRGGRADLVSEALTHYTDLLYQHTAHRWTLTGGLNRVGYAVRSPGLYGAHVAYQWALFGQAVWTSGPWRGVLGLRGEYYRSDQDTPLRYPVVRLGLNRRLGAGGNVYLTVGQGVRIPSIAERFVQTQAGGLKIFPNPDLRPERGWAGEVGLRQAFRWRSWKGLYEGAAFAMDYRDMIEFRFGLWLPDTFDPLNTFQYLGFSARNTTHARIIGTEHKLMWRRDGTWHYQGWAAVTLTRPVNMTLLAADSPDYLLNYRTPRMAKSFHEIGRGPWRLFGAVQYYGPLTGVDPAFTFFIQGMKEHLEKDRGSVVADLGAAYRWGRDWQVQAVVKNAANAFYMPVPGNVGPPRRLVFSLRYDP